MQHIHNGKRHEYGIGHGGQPQKDVWRTRSCDSVVTDRTTGRGHGMQPSVCGMLKRHLTGLRRARRKARAKRGEAAT